MTISSKNLKFLRKQKGLTQGAFSEELGIKRSLLGAYEEGRAEPKLEVIKQICTMFDISFEDLLIKDLTSKKSNSELSIVHEEQQAPYNSTRLQSKLKKDKNIIHFVPIKAAAGYLAGFSDESFLDELNSFTLPMLSSGNYRAFEIEGDSMLPTPSGSVIIGEKTEKLEDVKSYNTYILLVKGQGIVYKRIIIGNDNSNVTLLSDNTIFEPYTIPSNEILQIWKAILVIQKPERKKPDWNVQNLVNVVQDMHKKPSKVRSLIKN